MFNIRFPDSIQVVLGFVEACHNMGDWERQIRLKQNECPETALLEKDLEIFMDDLEKLADVTVDTTIVAIKALDIREEKRLVEVELRDEDDESSVSRTIKLMLIRRDGQRPQFDLHFRTPDRNDWRVRTVMFKARGGRGGYISMNLSVYSP